MNNKDMTDKGRRIGRTGIRSRNRKLTDTQHQEIKSLWMTGMWDQRELADKYGRCQSEIYRVIHDKFAKRQPAGKRDTSPIKLDTYP
jgi:hypothetical protein